MDSGAPRHFRVPELTTIITAALTGHRRAALTRIPRQEPQAVIRVDAATIPTPGRRRPTRRGLSTRRAARRGTSRAARSTIPNRELLAIRERIRDRRGR